MFYVIFKVNDNARIGNYIMSTAVGQVMMIDEDNKMSSVAMSGNDAYVNVVKPTVTIGESYYSINASSNNIYYEEEVDWGIYYYYSSPSGLSTSNYIMKYDPDEFEVVSVSVNDVLNEDYMFDVNNNISGGKSYTSSNEKLDSNVLNIFDKDINNLSNRFSSIGECDVNTSSKCPLKMLKACVIVDSLTNKKVLRIEGLNNSVVSIKSVNLSITPLGDLFNPLGVYEDVFFDLGCVEANNKCLSNFGVILPDDASIVEFTITKVMFSDGLYWDSNDVTYSVSTFEKQEFDTKLFIELLNK